MAVLDLTLALDLSEWDVRDWLAQRNIEVVEAPTPQGMWGAYDLSGQTVYLRAGMPSQYRLPTLLHEAEHVDRGDAGHQARSTEDRIDEDVARALVNPSDYAFWESQLGWQTAGIAAALDLPKWVIRAYRRALARAE